MGNSLSSQKAVMPSAGPVDLYAWPMVIVGVDPTGKFQPLACTAPAFATSTITGNGPANNETVVLGGKTYTFKTTLTPAEGEVALGANETAALLNLKNAINGAGGTNGTNYQVDNPHPTIMATASSSTTVTISAREPGTPGNLIATTATGGVTVTGATLAGGAFSSLITTAAA